MSYVGSTAARTRDSARSRVADGTHARRGGRRGRNCGDVAQAGRGNGAAGRVLVFTLFLQGSATKHRKSRRLTADLPRFERGDFQCAGGREARRHGVGDLARQMTAPRSGLSKMRALTALGRVRGGCSDDPRNSLPQSSFDPEKRGVSAELLVALFGSARRRGGSRIEREQADRGLRQLRKGRSTHAALVFVGCSTCACHKDVSILVSSKQAYLPCERIGETSLAVGPNVVTTSLHDPWCTAVNDDCHALSDLIMCL